MIGFIEMIGYPVYNTGTDVPRNGNVNGASKIDYWFADSLSFVFRAI